MSRLHRSRKVVVNDIHFDSSIWSAKAEGRPNLGRPAPGDRLPQRPSAAVLLAVEHGRGVHGAEARRLGHRSQGHHHIVVGTDCDLTGFAGPLAGDARHDRLAVLFVQPRSVTFVFNSNFTPRSSSHA
jgi:hypothetical protein